MVRDLEPEPIQLCEACFVSIANLATASRRGDPPQESDGMSLSQGFRFQKVELIPTIVLQFGVKLVGMALVILSCLCFSLLAAQFVRLHLLSTTQLIGFHSQSDPSEFLVRLGSGPSSRIMIYDRNEGTLWSFSEKGKLVAKLSVNTLPIEPPVPVKQRVRVSDFAPTTDGRVVLAEGNTASLYEVAFDRGIVRRVQLDNSPTGVVTINEEMFLVFYDDFSGKHASIVHVSGKVLDKKKVGETGLIPGSGKVKISLSKPNYFLTKPHELFLLSPDDKKITQIWFKGNKIITQSLDFPFRDESIVGAGCHPTAGILWLVLREADQSLTSYEIDWGKKQVLREGKNTVPDDAIGGFQHLHYFYGFRGGKILKYGY